MTNPKPTLAQLQKPLNLSSSNSQNWIALDRQRRMKQEEEERKRTEQIELEKKEELIRIKKKAQETLGKQTREWASFYDGKGFQMRMYFGWWHDHRYFVSPVNTDEKQYWKYKWNYVYSSSDYPNGTDTIRPFYGTYKDFVGGTSCRDKGCHVVRNFVGTVCTFDPEPYK